MTGSGSHGFSRSEFIFLIVAGLAIAGLLAHFIFDQSIQVERLKALVQRDALRMTLEERFSNPEILKKSVQHLGGAADPRLRSCLLGQCSQPDLCCRRAHYAVPLYNLGDDAGVFAGTADAPTCLMVDGQPTTNVKSCFAKVSATLEPVCQSGQETCDHASAVLVHYRLEIQAAFLKDDEARLQRTLSVVF